MGRAKNQAGRQSISTKTKLLVAVFLCLLFLLAMGAFVPFLPSKAVMIAAAVISGGLTLYLRNKLNGFIKLVSGMIEKKYISLAFKALWVLILFVFLYETIARPIPYLLNQVIGQGGYERTEITGKDFAVNNTSKRYYINTEIASWFLIDRGLTISEKQYSHLQVGDSIRLDGKKSLLGISINRITKAK